MKYVLVLLCCCLFSYAHAQKIYPPDALIFSKSSASNRLSLYQPSAKRIVIFERNLYWFIDLNGNIVEGPFSIGIKKVEPVARQLSPSGNLVLLTYGPEEVGDEYFQILFNLDKRLLVNADKISYSYDMAEVSFASDSALRWYAHNKFDEDPINKLWDFSQGREKYFGTDTSGNGYPDYTMYKRLLLYSRKSRDSLFLNSMDSTGKKYAATIITGVHKKTVSRFAGGYPYLYIDQPAGISIYRYGDTTYKRIDSIEGNYSVHIATADSNNCYLLLEDNGSSNDRFIIYDVGANAKIQIDHIFHPKTIFQFYPAEKLLVASHPWDGSIEFFSATNGSLIRKIIPADSKPATFNKVVPDSNTIQQSVSVLIRQSADNSFQNFYDEERSELIQVRRNKLSFLDAASGCIKRSVPFNGHEGRGPFEISDSKKYILSYSPYSKDKWLYPENIQIANVGSGKVVLNIQSTGGGRTFAKFLKNNLLFVKNETDTGDVFYMCDLDKDIVNKFTFPRGYSLIMDATTYQVQQYFLLQNYTSLLLQGKDGKLLFRKRIIGKNDSAFLTPGSPYLVVRTAGQGSAIYQVTASQIKFINKIPANYRISSTFGTDQSCIIYYINTTDGRRYRYDLTTGSPIISESVSPQLSNISTEISSIAYSPDGRYLATANPGNGKVMLWDLGTGKETKVLKVEKSGYITQLCFTPAGDRLAASSGDIWETASGNNLLSVTNRNIYNVNTIDVSCDGKYIISGGAYILLWDAETGEILDSYIKLDSSAYRNELGGGIKEDYPLMIHSAAFHPNSKIFATGNKRGMLEVRDIDTGFINRKFLATSNQVDQKIFDIKYSKSGAFIFAMQKRTLYKLNSTTLDIVDSISPPLGSEFFSLDIAPGDTSLAIIVSTGGTQTVQVRRVSDLGIIMAFSTPGAVFNKISFSPNKLHLATASDDGFCTVWDIATGKAVMYLNNIGEYGNVMVTPDNYYMASKSALNEVAFTINDEYYSFDQFDIYLNRPDIVLERLHYASPDLLKFYRQAYYKRLSKMKGNTDTTIVYDVPVLEITNRNVLPSSTKIGKHQLVLQIKDSLSLEGRIDISINNNKVYSKVVKERTARVDIELGDGKNFIDVVYTNGNKVESRRQKLNIEYTPVKPAPAKIWYIGIGVSKYKDSAMNLHYAAKDIKDIAAAIRKKYPAASIDTLLDASATKERIAALKKKLLNTGINDKVIVSFSGHGLVDDSLNWYFATYDINFNKPNENGLAYNAMQDLLDGIPARQKLLLLDACHSGEQDKENDITFANKETSLEEGVKETGAKGVTIRVKNSSKVGLQNSFELMQELFANLQYGNGASVIAAAGGKEYAYENETWNNGVFTYSLLKALRSKGTDEDENGQVSVKELKRVIFESVKALTGGRQKPTSRVEVYENWVLW